jgi:hypothetical protein
MLSGIIVLLFGVQQSQCHRSVACTAALISAGGRHMLHVGERCLMCHGRGCEHGMVIFTQPHWLRIWLVSVVVPQVNLATARSLVICCVGVAVQRHALHKCRVFYCFVVLLLRVILLPCAYRILSA